MRVVLLLLSAAALPAAAQPDLAAGGARYRLYCASCHGQKGHGGRAPELVSSRWTHGGSDDEIARTVAKGITGTGMAGFGDQFDESDVRELVAFIRSLAAAAPSTAPKGNAARGRDLYWGQGNCASCHMGEPQEREIYVR